MQNFSDIILSEKANHHEVINVVEYPAAPYPHLIYRSGEIQMRFGICVEIIRQTYAAKTVCYDSGKVMPE